MWFPVEREICTVKNYIGITSAKRNLGFWGEYSESMVFRLFCYVDNSIGFESVDVPFRNKELLSLIPQISCVFLVWKRILNEELFLNLKFYSQKIFGKYDSILSQCDRILAEGGVL